MRLRTGRGSRGYSGLLLGAGLAILAMVAPACQRASTSTETIAIAPAHIAKGHELRLAGWEPDLPADIVLMIDQSGSMSKGRAPTDPTGVRIKGSLSFLEFLAARSSAEKPTRFGVVSFGSNAPRARAISLQPTGAGGQAALRQFAAQVRPIDLGDTNFLAAFKTGMQLLKEAHSFAQPRNRAFVVFTDGEPDDARHLKADRYFGEIQAFLSKETKAPRRVDIFILGIDGAGNRWSSTVPAWQKVVGNDNVFTTPNLASLNSNFNRIVQKIWHLPDVIADTADSSSPRSFDLEPYLAAVDFHLFPENRGLTLRIFRADGTEVKPGEDRDAPAIQRLSTFERITVLDPKPGTWRYEVIGGAGKIEVLRNPIPLRMRLLSPNRIHPLGKPMRLMAEFVRLDGRPVEPDPNYPLALAAEVEPPAVAPVSVKFPLEKRRNHVYPGEPEIKETAARGQWTIVLKVTGGGSKFQSKQPVDVTIDRVPYVVVESPAHGAQLIPAPSVRVKAHLEEAGNRISPTGAFTNHPDQLVLAQLTRTDDGKRGAAVWLAHSTPEGTFEGEVPVPDGKDGHYSLAVRLAPEDRVKSLSADQTMVEFILAPLPMAAWLKWLLGLGALTLIGGIAGAVVMKRRRDRLKLTVFCQADSDASFRTVVFRNAGETQQLLGLPLKLRRDGDKKILKLVLSEEGKIESAPQGSPRELTIQDDVLVSIEPTSGEPFRIALTFKTPPTRPTRPVASGSGPPEEQQSRSSEAKAKDPWS